MFSIFKNVFRARRFNRETPVGASARGGKIGSPGLPRSLVSPSAKPGRVFLKLENLRVLQPLHGY